MIKPPHRIAIADQVKGARKRLYPLTMISCIVSAWVCAGYDRDEVTELVDSLYHAKENTTNADTADQ